MLAALVLAAACAGWHGDVAGHYLGQVESRGPKAIDTWIEDTPQGLAGSYVLHESEREVTGTLEPLGDEDCDVALFKWTDLYGTGVARLRFHPDAHCFEGSWGLEHPDPVLTWRSCTRSRVTS
jgi:hypothetical protein